MKYNIYFAFIIFALVVPDSGSAAIDQALPFQNRRICKVISPFLDFQPRGGGVVRASALQDGVGIPVDTDKEGVSMSWLTNIQSVFALPQNIERYEKKLGGDITVDLIKLLLTRIFERNGLGNVETFQKMECEMTQSRTRNYFGLLEDILHVTLPRLN